MHRDAGCYHTHTYGFDTWALGPPRKLQRASLMTIRAKDVTDSCIRAGDYTHPEHLRFASSIEIRGFKFAGDSSCEPDVDDADKAASS